jgi:hypothetical protein
MKCERGKNKMKITDNTQPKKHCLLKDLAALTYFVPADNFDKNVYIYWDDFPSADEQYHRVRQLGDNCMSGVMAKHSNWEVIPITIDEIIYYRREP